MYVEAPDGEKKKPPYMDFWHYLCDVCEPSYIWIPREVDIDSWEENSAWEGWQQQITDLIFEEFGEYADGDDLRVWVEW